MNNESYLLHQDRCPKCTEEGHDKSGDNLGVYSDGHCYCFRCGYFIGGNGVAKLIHQTKAVEEHKVMLPYDVDINYPHKALEWVEQYELNKNDLLSNNSLWSESHQRLYFPVYGDEGLLAFQGRYFGNSDSPERNKKWWGKGDLRDVVALYGRQGRSLVLVEDVISAIKVARFTQSWWLAGNSVGIDRWKRLYKIIPRGLQVDIWLDPDMDSQSIKQAALGRSCGINAGVIFSSKDPKEMPMSVIKGILNNGR